MSIARGTTPTLEFNLPFNISGHTGFVTISQRGEELISIPFDQGIIQDNTLIVQLSQEDTLLLDHRYLVELQIRGKDAEGNAYITHIERDSVDRILKEEVI